jgi:hypothetical protein
VVFVDGQQQAGFHGTVIIACDNTRKALFPANFLLPQAIGVCGKHV